MPKSRYLSYALKWYEDELFNKHIPVFERIEHYFNDATVDETRMVAEHYVQAWHLFLRTYFAHIDDAERFLGLFEHIGLAPEAVREIHKLASELRTYPWLREVIEGFYTDFLKLLLA